MKIKPSLIWAILGSIPLFFLLNHWMSCEITTPAPVKPVVQESQPVENKQVFEQPKQTEPIPGVPIDGEIVEPEVQKVKKAVAPTPEDDGTHEPIYEAPSDSTILTQ